MKRTSSSARGRRRQTSRDNSVASRTDWLLDMLLENKTAVITGNPYGSGRESAALVEREGARVMCVDDTDEGWASNGGVKTGRPDYVADVTDAKAVADVVAQCESAVGRVDVLFNLAGRAT